MSISLDQLAASIGASVVGNGSTQVRGCAPIDRAGPEEVSFLVNARYARFLDETAAAAVLVRPDTPTPEGLTRLNAEDPYLAFRNAMIELHGFRSHPDVIGCSGGATISDSAAVHEDAQIADGVMVHPHVTIERGAVVGRGTVLYPGVYVGADVTIGEDCVLYPNVTIYDRCHIGTRVTLHSSTVIGQDGFGYATSNGEHHKIPQHGIVIIEDDVELGAGCAIERAAMGATTIGRGTKFADLISIGHGTTVGAHCLFVSLVGVAGSVSVGDHVVLGGQTGVSGHLTIGDGVQVMAQSGIAGDVAPGSRVGGAPVVPLDAAKRNLLAGMHLGDMLKRLRSLERRLAELGEDRE
jgi:UDP-3-O-[3-hydroxymyristoyl] glucosamine N-acyltransferase